ncbi:hypothetical protein IQ243_26440 [Nostocales cyanobacterium LEGE 11386]|nr:hypothetical protein [Nostocales cyanobacterium LEGE 11386]
MEITLSGQETVDLVWQESNGIRWKTVTLSEIENNHDEYLDHIYLGYKQISFESRVQIRSWRLWQYDPYPDEFHLLIKSESDEDEDPFTITRQASVPELLNLIKLGFIAEFMFMFKQGKTDSEVIAELEKVDADHSA